MRGPRQKVRGSGWFVWGILYKRQRRI